MGVSVCTMHECPSDQLKTGIARQLIQMICLNSEHSWKTEHTFWMS